MEHKSKWSFMKSLEEQFEDDLHRFRAFQTKKHDFKEPKKIELPSRECDLCRRLQAQHKGEKSLKDVLNEMLSHKPLNRKFEYINMGPDRFKDDKNAEPVIYVSQILNKGTRKIAIEAHDFEYDHTTIKLTRKEVVEQNIEVYPCFRRELSINNISITDHVKNLVRNFETEEKEPESLHEEPESLHEEPESLRKEPESLHKGPESLSEEPDSLLEEQEFLNKRAESVCEKLLSLRDRFYNDQKKRGLFKV